VTARIYPLAVHPKRVVPAQPAAAASSGGSGAVERVCVAAATIGAGQPVRALAPATAGAPVRVAPLDRADLAAGVAFFGVAQDAAEAGELVDVLVAGEGILELIAEVTDDDVGTFVWMAANGQGDITPPTDALTDHTALFIFGILLAQDGTKVVQVLLRPQLIGLC
jgi:hypothetical protein